MPYCLSAHRCPLRGFVVRANTLTALRGIQDDCPPFEFATHVANNGTRLVIVSMASPTSEFSRAFSRTPKEPDMEASLVGSNDLSPSLGPSGMRR